jgi:PhoH-like ATPase
MSVVVDTNILLDNPEIVKELDVVILSHVLRELEKHKKSSDNELAYKARRATRIIDSNEVKIDPYDYTNLLGSQYDDNYEDNRILSACLKNGYSLLTSDVLMRFKAKGFGIDVLDVEEDEEDYKGYKEVTVSDEEINYIYQNLDQNKWDLLQNQYLILKDTTGEVVDALRWDGKYLVRVSQKGFTTLQFGKFKPYDYYQQCALDSISNNQLTMIKGKAGSGKTLLALNYAWYQVEKGKYSKLVIFFNPVNAGKTSSKLGFYKGNKNEKLLDGQLGAILGSKFGDVSVVESYIASGKLVILPFADIRGVDVIDSITLISEAQNLDRELMKIAIQRISKSSKLIIDGDYNQVDASIFEGNQNGMKRVSEVFRGKKMYGEIELPFVYRSEIAEIADEL